MCLEAIKARIALLKKKGFVTLFLIQTILYFKKQCIGLQNNINPPTWVLGLNFEVTIKDGVSKKVTNRSSYKVPSLLF